MDRKTAEFVANKLWETIMAHKNCKRCGDYFPIFSGDQELLHKLAPRIWDQSFELPLPTLCPTCRRKRRMSYRNERKLYRNKCSLTWKSVISVYSPESWNTVYEQNAWEWDWWDFRDYAMDYDLNKFFSEQFNELMKRVPRKSLLISKEENSDYANYCSYLKNCYLLYDSSNSEDCFYCYDLWRSKDTVDCNDCLELTNSYECVNSLFSYNAFFSYNVVNCADVYFSVNLEWCKHCIFSTNLVNKEYCIENKQVSRQEFEAYLADLKQKMSSSEWLKLLLDKYKEIKKKSIYKNLQLVETDNVIWNFINQSKNVLASYDSGCIEDNRYVSNTHDTRDCMDFESCSQPCTKCYEINGTMLCHSSAFGIITWCDYSYYIDHCFHSKNCFWSIWVRNWEYVILNKQYAKEEYEKLVPQIIETMKQNWEWWEFFSPAKIKLFPYNDTIAYDFFPLYKMISSDWKEQIIDENWRWVVYIEDSTKYVSPAKIDFWWEEKVEVLWRTQEKEINVPDWIELIQAKDLPDNIKDISDDILKKAVVCEVSWRPFRIISKELEFYKKNWISLPHKHPDIRHANRIKQRPFRELYLRKCDKCGVEMISVYPQESEYKVYCEECYNKEIY